MKRFLFCLCLLTAIGGCAMRGNGPSLDVAPVKSAPVVYVYPLHNTYRQATVGVLPFQTPAAFERNRGLEVSALFKDVLLGKRAFPVVRQLTDSYGDLTEAVAVGRRAGVDLVLAGRLSYALAGTEFGGARLAVSIRLLNTRTGNTVWYMEQAMDQPMDYPDLGFWNRFLESFSLPEVRPPRGAPPLPNMLAEIAVDMADVMAGARYVSR